MTSERPNSRESIRDLFVVAGLAALVLTIYAQTAGFQFINLDDNLYVYENQAVLSGLNWESVKWAFTVFHSGNWHPLTWISLALDVQLFGNSPGMLHVVNVILHFLNTVLAFVVFRRMTGAYWPSAFVAALFAVHPMHVESVAWISERKDLLSTAFWLLSIWFYVRWNEEGASPWTGLYFASLGMFALGLMSKPMVITLPFVLLLLDIWPLERIREGGRQTYVRLIVEKAPFFALSIASAFVTVAAQRTVSAVESLTILPLDVRIQNAVLSYAKYISSAFFPARLAVWYPYDRELGVVEVGAAALLLTAVTAVCVWQFSRRKYLLVGWLWFVGTLVPLIGIVQVGGQSMADRYTYLPYFGLFIMVAFGAAELADRFRLDRRLVATAAAASIIALAIPAYFQTTYWRDNNTLYTRTLSVTENNFLIEQNYCHALMEQDRLDEAERLCRDSIEHRPNYFESLNTLGIVSFKRKDYAAAETLFRTAIDSGTSHPLTYSNLALSQILQGKPAEGEANLQKAVELSGNRVSPLLFVETLKSLVDEYLKQGNTEKAAENLKRLRFVQPENIEARMKLVELLIDLKRFDEAAAETETILRADPNNAAAWNNLGVIMLAQSQKKKAAEAFENALKLRPDYEEAKKNLLQAKN
jgi:Flp pilus assembly protein TadD